MPLHFPLGNPRLPNFLPVRSFGVETEPSLQVDSIPVLCGPRCPIIAPCAPFLPCCPLLAWLSPLLVATFLRTHAHKHPWEGRKQQAFRMDRWKWQQRK